MTHLDRRALLAAPALLILPGVALGQSKLGAEDGALVNKASAYLQGLTRVKGRFMQTSARGAVTRGAVYIQRPGKARFAYDPPSNLLVVSDGHNVIVSDARLKTFDTYPLGATPLSLFLSKSISLDEGVVITAVQRFNNGFSVTAKDGRRQAEGQITLSFTDNPISLAAWVMTDAQGATTRVVLSDLQAVPSLDPKLFQLRDPRPRTGRT